MTADAKRAAQCLRDGDRLVHDRQAGEWTLLRKGEAVEPRDISALPADGALGLTPAGDHLPGFPKVFSQTWTCGSGRRQHGPPCRQEQPELTLLPPQDEAR